MTKLQLFVFLLAGFGISGGNHPQCPPMWCTATANVDGLLNNSRKSQPKRGMKLSGFGHVERMDGKRSNIRIHNDTWEDELRWFKEACHGQVNRVVNFLLWKCILLYITILIISIYQLVVRTAIMRTLVGWNGSIQQGHTDEMPNGRVKTELHCSVNNTNKKL